MTEIRMGLLWVVLSATGLGATAPVCRTELARFEPVRMSRDMQWELAHAIYRTIVHSEKEVVDRMSATVFLDLQTGAFAHWPAYQQQAFLEEVMLRFIRRLGWPEDWEADPSPIATLLRESNFKEVEDRILAAFRAGFLHAQVIRWFPKNWLPGKLGRERGFVIATLDRAPGPFCPSFPRETSVEAILARGPLPWEAHAFLRRWFEGLPNQISKRYFAYREWQYFHPAELQNILLLHWYLYPDGLLSQMQERLKQFAAARK